MSCRRSTAAIQADIDKWKLKLAAAEETLDGINAVANESNSFNDNEGAQSVKKRKISEQTDYIDYIEDKLQKLYAELNGKCTVVRHLNRRNISGGGINI